MIGELKLHTGLPSDENGSFGNAIAAWAYDSDPNCQNNR